MSQPSRKRLVVVVAAIVVILLIAFFALKHQKPAIQPVQVTTIDTTGLPHTGQAGAPNTIVAVEDLKCFGCMMYNTRLYPDIKKQLIDTGKANYHVLLMSFLPGSKPAANTAMCLREQNPAYFFDFVHYAYAHQPPETQNWAIPARLFRMAVAAVPNVDKTKLTQCMLSNKYQKELGTYLERASKIMGDKLVTPTLFVNGHQVRPITMAAIKKYLK